MVATSVKFVFFHFMATSFIYFNNGPCQKRSNEGRCRVRFVERLCCWCESNRHDDKGGAGTGTRSTVQSVFLIPAHEPIVTVVTIVLKTNNQVAYYVSRLMKQK